MPWSEKARARAEKAAKARWAATTAEERQAFARRIANIRWAKRAGNDMGQEQSAIFAKTYQRLRPWASERPEMECVSLREAERIALANAEADQIGLFALADLSMPPDIRDFGERMAMPEFGAQLWRCAFVAGFRAAIRASQGPLPKSPLTPEQKAELAVLAAMSDNEIDFSDIPPREPVA